MPCWKTGSRKPKPSSAAFANVHGVNAPTAPFQATNAMSLNQSREETWGVGPRQPGPGSSSTSPNGSHLGSCLAKRPGNSGAAKSGRHRSRSMRKQLADSSIQQTFLQGTVLNSGTCSIRPWPFPVNLHPQQHPHTLTFVLLTSEGMRDLWVMIMV